MELVKEEKLKEREELRVELEGFCSEKEVDPRFNLKEACYLE